MLAQILLMLGQAIAAVIGWFAALVSGELWTLIFSMIVMALVARFIIFPFIGGYISGTVSDSVKSSRGLETSKQAQARREESRARAAAYQRERSNYYRQKAYYFYRRGR